MKGRPLVFAKMGFDIELKSRVTFPVDHDSKGRQKVELTKITTIIIFLI